MTTYKPKDDSCLELALKCFLALAGLAAIIGGSTAVGWYRAGVQAEVYERQGVHMTQWEVFIGIKPAERTVNIKEAEPR